jgi:hypothetical protein
MDRTKQNKNQRPTPENYETLQFAWAFFNERLFDDQLPPCMITLQRFHKSSGYFVPNGWQDENGTISDEISLNPAYMRHCIAEGDLETPLSTLVHEQCHQWQHHYGFRKSLRGYHNIEWARKMESVGLIASDTRDEGGKQTGYRMSHYIEDGGRFDVACQELIKRGFKINWTDNWNRQPKGVRKTHYKCPQCQVSCWSKPMCSFICGKCSCEMFEVA